MGEISYGGFFPENIKWWVIQECLESGNPEDFFRVLREVIYGLDDEWDENENFWEELSIK